MAIIPRKQYTDLFGPTVGDRFHLADTNLVVEVEYDHNAGSYGEEAVYGGGKAIRDGMAQDPPRSTARAHSTSSSPTSWSSTRSWAWSRATSGYAAA